MPPKHLALGLAIAAAMPAMFATAQDLRYILYLSDRSIRRLGPPLRLSNSHLSPLNQGTSILACRAKRLIARDRGYDLVIVPRAA
jgi:hypothetical protein